MSGTSHDVRERLDRRPARSWRKRLLLWFGLLLLATVMILTGPLMIMLVTVVVLAGLAIDLVVGRPRRRRRAEEARARRRERLEQAIEAGGVPDTPSHGRGRQDASKLAGHAAGPKYGSNVWGWWPRGRI